MRHLDKLWLIFKGVGREKIPYKAMYSEYGASSQ